MFSGGGTQGGLHRVSSINFAARLRCTIK
jgi:hypothetical protein